MKGLARHGVGYRQALGLPSVSNRGDLILGDDALLYIAYVMFIWAPLSQLLGGAAVDPQLISMTAD